MWFNHHPPGKCNSASNDDHVHLTNVSIIIIIFVSTAAAAATTINIIIFGFRLTAYISRDYSRLGRVRPRFSRKNFCRLPASVAQETEPQCASDQNGLSKELGSIPGRPVDFAFESQGRMLWDYFLRQARGFDSVLYNLWLLATTEFSDAQ